MGHALLWAVKDYWHLTSLLPLVVSLALGVALLYVRQTAPWGRRWLTLVILGYWALATPFGSWLIAAPLMQGQHRIASASDAAGAQAVVVLGGGINVYRADDLTLNDLNASALRVIEGVRIYRLLGDPLLIVSGGNTPRVDPPQPEGDALRRAAMELGVPPARVLADNVSMTTYEQGKTLSRMLRERGISRFVLVTSPIHMPRSIAAFRAFRLEPVPSTSVLRRDPDAAFWTVMPDRESLNIADGALYEYAARAYYWLRGWLKEPVEPPAAKP
jgi:uncharacterized SAM-binding protein YcdF (DUF218 family)